MRARAIVVAAAAIGTLTAGPAAAQVTPPALTPLQTAVACTLPPALAEPRTGGLRVIGAQDTVARYSFGAADLLIIGGGSKAGLQVGQRFYVRRPVTFGGNPAGALHAVRTSGWIRIVSLNDTAAVAAVEVICATIMEGDYLDQFVPPVVPDGADRTDTKGQPDFSTLGHVLFGDEEVPTGGAGDFMLVDRSANKTLGPGARLAIYRDLKIRGLPLTWIGEAIVISTSTQTALVRITTSRDAVQEGDVVAVRK